MRSFFLLFLYSLLPSAIIAQSDMVRPTPHWAEGDARRVAVTTTTRITMDTVHMDISAESSYTLKVEQARKDRYVLVMSMESNDELFGQVDARMQGASGAPAMDSIMLVMAGLMREVCAPLIGTGIRFAVSPQGEALERIGTGKEHERTKAALGDGVVAMVRKMASLSGEPPPEMPPAVVSHIVDSIYGSYVQVQVNELNYLLRPYANTYPTTGSLRQPTLIHDVDAPLRKEAMELPGTCELGLDKETPQELVCRTILTYDPEALRAAFAQDDNASAMEGLRMTEECVDHIDRKTGWITSSTSVITLRTNTMTVRVDARNVLTLLR